MYVHMHMYIQATRRYGSPLKGPPSSVFQPVQLKSENPELYSLEPKTLEGLGFRVLTPKSAQP